MDKEESLYDLYKRTGLSQIGEVLKIGEKEMEELIQEKHSLPKEKEVIEREDKKKDLFKELYRTIIEILKDYIDMKEEYYPIVSLWILGTYIHKEFMTYPYLYFNAMKGSGKSRVLSLIAYLSHNGKMVVNMSEAVLFRTAKNSTICIDEFERVKGKEKANLRELLNAAYKRGISVERATKVKKKDAEGFEIEKFDVFCPVAMANISGMDDVLGDRSLKMTLERTSKSHISRKLEIWGVDALISTIKKKLTEFLVLFSDVSAVNLNTYKYWNELLITLNTNNIKQHKTTHPKKTLLLDKILKTSLDGRHLELFFPLFLLADLCGDLDKIIKISEIMVKEKKEEDVYENRDVSLIDFISKNEKGGEYITQKELLIGFKEFIEAEDDRWLTSQWFGRALGRLNLVYAKRRLGRGSEVILNIEKAKEKIKMFK